MPKRILRQKRISGGQPSELVGVIEWAPASKAQVDLAEPGVAEETAAPWHLLIDRGTQRSDRRRCNLRVETVLSVRREADVRKLLAELDEYLRRVQRQLEAMNEE